MRRKLKIDYEKRFLTIEDYTDIRSIINEMFFMLDDIKKNMIISNTDIKKTGDNSEVDKFFTS